ncbi:hypothetical protein BJV77DRAFT_332278 [Russula vinacea]|nr:hypothetical protein BJV77DRAFT_332278 [Russula vinacea]
MDPQSYSQASSVSEPCFNPFSRPDEPRVRSLCSCCVSLTRPANGLLKGRPSELSLPAPEQQLSSRHSAPPPELPEQVERDETSRNPMSTSPQLKAINGRAHDKPLRVPSRLPRPDSPLIPPGVNGNGADVKGASPGSATRFGWQFPRSRPQLPEFEPDTSSPERSPSPVHRPTVVLLALEYQATFLCDHRVRYQRSRLTEMAMPGHSRKATNAQRPNSRKPTNSLPSLKAPTLNLHEGAMKAYRTLRPPLHGRSRFHHLRSFIHFLPSVLSLLLMIPTPRRLRLQPQLPLMRNPPLNSLLLLVRPLAPPKSNLRLRRRLQTFLTSLVHLRYPKMRRGASTLCLESSR